MKNFFSSLAFFLSLSLSKHTRATIALSSTTTRKNLQDRPARARLQKWPSGSDYKLWMNGFGRDSMNLVLWKKNCFFFSSHMCCPNESKIERSEFCGSDDDVNHHHGACRQVCADKKNMFAALSRDNKFFLNPIACFGRALSARASVCSYGNGNSWAFSLLSLFTSPFFSLFCEWRWLTACMQIFGSKFCRSHVRLFTFFLRECLIFLRSDNSRVSSAWDLVTLI
jgi:hypothetical protein